MRPALSSTPGGCTTGFMAPRPQANTSGSGTIPGKKRVQRGVHAGGGHGREDAQAQVRNDAPDRGFGGTGLAADVGRGVGLGHRNRRRAGFTQDARDFQRSQGAGHQGQGVVVAQVWGQCPRPGRVAVGGHDDQQRVGGRRSRRHVVRDSRRSGPRRCARRPATRSCANRARGRWPRERPAVRPGSPNAPPASGWPPPRSRCCRRPAPLHP